MNLFETKSVINENTLKELKLYFITPTQKIICFLGVVLSVYLVIALESFLFILTILAFIAVIPLTINRSIKIIVARIQETTNAKEYECTTSFGDDGLNIINHSTNGASSISYDNFKRFVETKNYYALFTEANQFVVVNKREIDQAQKKDDLTGFIKSHCKNLTNPRKTRMILIALSCLVCVYFANWYFEFGRTIFESRAEPSEAEMETIHEIIAFEQQKLSECKELLSAYNDRASELGIEIRPVLSQTRAVNNQGLVENHDLNNELWLPKYYSSEIMCWVYKDGELLERRSYNSTSYFVTMFWLVHARKNEDVVEYNENPFDGSYVKFDSSIESLLKQVSDFIQDETA